MSLAIAYQVKKRSKKMAKGGDVKGVHKDEGLFDQGSSRAGIKAREYAKDSGSSNSQKMGVKRWIKGQHNKVLDEMREMPNPKLKGLAEGGKVKNAPHEDYVNMLVKERGHQSKEEMHEQASKYDQMSDRASHPKSKSEHKQSANAFREAVKRRGFTDGGMVGEQSEAHEEDMISRIMKKRFSHGGEVANDTDFSADEENADYDYLAHNDDLHFEETSANSGDELGNDAKDDREDDLITRVMKSRGRKDRNPSPV